MEMKFAAFAAIVESPGRQSVYRKDMNKILKRPNM